LEGKGSKKLTLPEAISLYGVALSYAREGAWSCLMDELGGVIPGAVLREVLLQGPEVLLNAGKISKENPSPPPPSRSFFERAEDPAYREKLRAEVLIHRYLSGRFGGVGEASSEGEGVSSGACPFVQKSDTGGAVPLRYRLVVAERGVCLYWVHEWQSRPPRPEWGPEGVIRRSMRRSLFRLAEAAWLLEGHAVPTHMLTLTLPKEVWEALPSDEARLDLWKAALDAFLDSLRVRLNRRFRREWGWLWWLEFQERGAPHLHVLLDLGGYLSVLDWWEWKDWITEAWSRALGVPAPFATRFEALEHRDFRYTRAYAFGSKKAPQKRFPFPGPWGHTYGVAGTWLEALRYERRRLREESSVYELEGSVLEALLLGLESALPSFLEGRDSPAATAFLRGLRRVREGRRYAVRVVLPPPSSLNGEDHPLIYAVLSVVPDLLESSENAPISAPPGPSLSLPPPAPPPPPWGGNGGLPPLEGGWGGASPPG